MNIAPAILVDLTNVCLKNSMNDHALAIGSELKTVPLKKKDVERLKNAFVQAGLENSLPKITDTISSENHEEVIPKLPVKQVDRAGLESSLSKITDTISSENHENLIKKLSAEGVVLFKYNNFR